MSPASLVLIALVAGGAPPVGGVAHPPGAVHIFQPERPAADPAASEAPAPNTLPRNLAVSRDTSAIVIAGPRSASVWSSQTGRLERRIDFDDQHGAVTTIRACDDGSVLIHAGDHIVRWTDDGEQRTVRLEDSLDHVQVAAFSPDGRLFAAFGDRPSVRVWETDTGRKRLELDESVWADLLQFSPDGRRLAVSRMVRLWLFDVTATAPLWKQRPEGTIRHLRFAPDGSRLTTLVDYDGLLDFDIEPATGQLRPADPFSLRRNIRHSRGGGSDRKLVAVSPDSTLVAESDGGATLRVWELTTARDVLVLDASNASRQPLSAVTFLPDSRRLVTGTPDGSGILWDLGSTDFAAEPSDGEPLTSDAAAGLWRQLGDDNGEAAWRALVALVHRPDEALRLIESPPSLDGLADRLISQLDGEDASLRSLASRRLTDMSVAVERLLRRGMHDRPSPEAAARLRRLLRRLAGPDKQQELEQLARIRRFRNLRTLRLLEWIGTAEARDVLLRLRHDPFIGDNPELAAEADRTLARWAVKPAHAPPAGTR